MVEKTAHYIEANITDSISVESVAEYMKLSSKYMNTVFKETTGMCISKFITECRMKKAAELLRDPMVKVYEVALMVGCNDTDYFRNLFFDQYEMTPSEYRDVVL